MKGSKLRSVGIGFPIMGVAEEAFWRLSGSERSLLILAHLADKERVREELGKNRDKWVNRFLAWVGLNPGYAWCAAYVSAGFDLAEVNFGPKSGRAAVRNWASWAKAHGLIRKSGEEPRRGDLFYWLNKDGTGHIGRVTVVSGNQVRTLEGNTNEAGSREGDGAYRRSRMNAGLSFIRVEV